MQMLNSGRIRKGVVLSAERAGTTWPDALGELFLGERGGIGVRLQNPSLLPIIILGKKAGGGEY